MSVTLSVAGEGDKDADRNIITPEFTAEALRNVRGLDCGVLDNSFYTSTDSTGTDRVSNSQGYNWECSVGNYLAGEAGGSISSGITVKRGMATAYGYDIRSEDTHTLTTVYSDATQTDTTITAGSGTKYLFVYLEINLGENPAGGYLRVHDNSNAPVWTSRTQDNLITTPGGKYQMPLHRITINSSGIVTAIDSWETLNLAETIERPLTAKNALYAVTQAEGTADTRIATTAFVDNVRAGIADELQSSLTDKITTLNSTLQTLASNVNTALSFSSTTFTVAGVEFWIKRLAGAVAGGLNTTTLNRTNATTFIDTTESAYDNGTTLATLTSTYRPTSIQRVPVVLNYNKTGQNSVSSHAAYEVVLQIATSGAITVASFLAAIPFSQEGSSVTAYVDSSFGWQVSNTTYSISNLTIPQVTPTVSVTLASVTDNGTAGDSDVKLTGVQTAKAGSKLTFGLEVHGYARTVLSVTATYKRYTSDTAYSSSTLTVTDNGNGTYSVTPASDTSTSYLKRIVEVSVTIGYEGAEL